MYFIFEFLDFISSMKSVITFTTWLTEYRIHTRLETDIINGFVPEVTPFYNEATDSVVTGLGFILYNFITILLFYIGYKMPQDIYNGPDGSKDGTGGDPYDMTVEDEFDYEDQELSIVDLKSDSYSKEPYTMNFINISPATLHCPLNFRIETNNITFFERLNFIGAKHMKYRMKNGEYPIFLCKESDEIYRSSNKERIVDFNRESDPELLIIRYYASKFKGLERGIDFDPQIIDLLVKSDLQNYHKYLPSYEGGFYFETEFNSNEIIKIKNNDIIKFNEINYLVNKVIQRKKYLFYYTFLKHLTFRRVDCSLTYLLKFNELDLLHFLIQIHQYNMNIKVLTGEDVIDFYLYLIKAYFLKDRKSISKIELLYYIDKIKMIYFLEKSKKEKIVLQKMYDKLKYNIFVEKEYLCVLKEKLNKFEEIVNREMKERSIFSNTNLFYFKNKFKKCKNKIKCL
jgi:hypothetical protein